MTPEDDDLNAPLEEREEQASIDEAETAEWAHDQRREADAKQGRIERETREHHLDEG